MDTCPETGFSEACLTCSPECCIASQADCWGGCTTVAWYHLVKNLVMIGFTIKAINEGTAVRTWKNFIYGVIVLGCVGDALARSAGLFSSSGEDQILLNVRWLIFAGDDISRISATSIPFLVLRIWCSVVKPLDPRPKWTRIERACDLTVTTMVLTLGLDYLPEESHVGSVFSYGILIAAVPSMIFAVIGARELFNFVAELANHALQLQVNGNGTLVKAAIQLRSITRGFLVVFAFTTILLPFYLFADRSTSIGCEGLECKWQMMHTCKTKQTTHQTKTE